MGISIIRDGFILVVQQLMLKSSTRLSERLDNTYTDFYITSYLPRIESDLMHVKPPYRAYMEIDRQ